MVSYIRARKLYDIFSYSSKLVIINAACYPAGKILPNKENAHITVREPFWWKGMIDGVANLFPNINYVVLASKTIKGDGFALPVNV